MARAALDVLPSTPAVRALRSLVRVIDQDPPGPAGPALMEYATALEADGLYEFAAEVYQLAAELGRREQGLILVPTALARVGDCLRSIHRFDEAQRAFRAAVVVGQEVGNVIAELLAEVGLANLDALRGRALAARLRLDAVIRFARTRDLRYPLAMALGDRSALRCREGDGEGAALDLAESLALEAKQELQTGALAEVNTVVRTPTSDPVTELAASVSPALTRRGPQRSPVN